jgi:hypothetical protein
LPFTQSEPPVPDELVDQSDPLVVDHAPPLVGFVKYSLVAACSDRAAAQKRQAKAARKHRLTGWENQEAARRRGKAVFFISG